MIPDPSTPVFQLTIAGEIHQLATEKITACGLPTSWGLTSTWGVVARYSPPCPLCWPNLEEKEDQR